MSLRQQLLDNNYVIIKDFITPEQANNLYETLKTNVEAHADKYDYIPVFYGNSLGLKDFKEGLKLLLNKIKDISDIVEEDVFPTYSYIRLYKNNSKLERHQDRPSCEISVTVHLGSDGNEWPFGIKKPNGEEVTLLLQPGQAIVYSGCIAEHWREETYKGNFFGQLFLHYVLANGSNSGHYFDRLVCTDKKYISDLY